jgi:hypothetical protein
MKGEANPPTQDHHHRGKKKKKIKSSKKCLARKLGRKWSLHNRESLGHTLDKH